MKKFFIIFVLIAFVLVEQTKAQKKVKENKIFKEWKEKKGIKWTDVTSEEEEKRAKNVMRRKSNIDKHNADPSQTYTKGSYDDDWMDSDERVNSKTGCKFPVEARALPKPPAFYNYLSTALPAAVDWSIHCQPIYHQGSCGNCYVFAALTTIECWYKIKGYGSISLSPQMLLDCETRLNKCNGGWPFAVFNVLNDYHNASCAKWADYPYTSYTYKSNATGYGTCKAVTKVPLRFTSPVQANVNGNEAYLKYILANHGPVAIGMWVSSAFNNYKSGSFFDPLCPKGTATIPQCAPQNINHAMVIVGYQTLNGIPVWKVRNSWGNLWGSAGYIYMHRNATNNCNAACFAMWVENN